MNGEIDFHVPDLEEFREGYELFNEKGIPGIDNIWFEALSTVQDGWENPSEMARGISRLISAWNRFYARFDLDAMSACITRNRAILNQFRNRNIASLSQEDTAVIRDLFKEFLIALQRKPDDRKSPVSVAKAFSLIAPHFFPIWDSNIAIAYDCFYSSDTGHDPYIRFCHKMKLMANRVRDFVPPEDDRPLLKRIDEYNISKYTSHFISQSEANKDQEASETVIKSPKPATKKALKSMTSEQLDQNMKVNSEEIDKLRRQLRKLKKKCFDKDAMEYIGSRTLDVYLRVTEESDYLKEKYIVDEEHRKARDKLLDDIEYVRKSLKEPVALKDARKFFTLLTGKKPPK